jgi:hypothetical protein
MEQTAQTFISVAKMPGFFSLMKESFFIYGQKWKTLLLIELVSFGFVIAAALLFAVIGTLSTIVGALSKNALAGIAIIIIAGAMAICLIVYASSWVGAAMIIVLRDKLESFGIREALKRAKPYAIPFLWITLASGLMIFAGTVLFIIPGIIFSVWFFCARYLVVTGKERGFDALLKSREYARGIFWKIFLLTLSGSIVSYIFSALLDPLKGSGSGQIITLIVTFLISPLWLIYFYLVFDYIRKIKGDVEIAAKAGQKNIYIAIAGLGLAVIAVIAGLLIMFAPQIKEIYQQGVKENRFPATMQDSNTPAETQIPLIN